LEFEKIHKEVVDAHNNLGILEEQIITCKQHENVIQDLISKSIRGTNSHRGLQPQPNLPLENIDPIPRTWITF
jgi:hypothetical protein